MLTAAKRLRRKAGRSDPQETEVPVQQVKEHRTDGDTAYRRSITQMPDDSGIDYSHKGDGNVRQDTGYGEPKYVAIRVLHLIRYTLFRRVR